MTASTSLYRKYRSQTFDELVGQEPVVRTLKNAIAANRISHAYLFTGPRGVGKTSAARLLARAANCTSEGIERPCNKCPNCLAGARETVTDLIEIDAASNTGVDNIREIIERANFAPSVWNTKFYIIDEVHMLSTSAFNALLKTLEEPPLHTSFILATTEVHKVPATVASRCQRFDFRRVPLKAMVERLQFICEQESIKAEPEALELVARQATGSLRDALSLLDQLRVYSDEAITLKSVQDMLGAGGSEEVAAFVDTLLSGNLAEGLRRINGVLEEGLDLRQFNRQIVDHLRGLMLIKSGAASGEGHLLDITDEMKKRLQKQAEGVTIPFLLRWIRAFADADAALRSTVYGQLPLEMAFVEATLPTETAASQPATKEKDRGSEIAAAVAPVGRMPEQDAPAKPADKKPLYTTAPPPIYTELGAIATNGKQPAFETKNDSMPADDDQTIEAKEIEAPPQSSEGELLKLTNSWIDFVDQVNARSAPLAGFLRNADSARPVAVQGGVCTIGFRWPTHAKTAMKNDPHPYRNVIETALSKVMGYKCRLETVTFAQVESGLASEEQVPPKQSKSPNVVREKPAPHETTRGKAAMNIFSIDKFDDPH